MNYYNIIKEKLCESGCTLLTTVEEYNEMYSKSKNKQSMRFRFIATCGHENDVAYTNFIIRKTGLLCKNCRQTKATNILKELQQEHSNNLGLITEQSGITLLEKFILDKYIVKRTNEGCTADLAIKDINCEDDKWIPVQIKVTSKKSEHKMYSFPGLKETYKDMLLICICIDEEKIWIIPYNDLNLKIKLNISARSKYNKYLVDDNINISSYIQKYINNIKYMELDTCMTPLCVLQQREIEYKDKREKYINFLTYKQPNIQQSRVDFIVNNKNIQEKVAGRVKRNSLMVTLACNNGKINKKRQYRSYRLGENDFYWFHSSIDDKFWIIPEIELYNNKYICGTDNTINKTNLYIGIEYTRKTQFLSKYEFNYLKLSDNDIIRIKHMFGC